MNRTTKLVVGVLGSLLLLVIGATAYAAFPATNGTVSACVLKSGGTIRIIDSATQSCRKSEVPLTWNQEGVPGTDGVSGYESVEREIIVEFDGPQGGVVVQGACPTGKAVMATSVIAFYENADNSFAGAVDQGYSLLRDTDGDGIRDGIEYQFFRSNGTAFEDGKHFRGVIRLNCIHVS